MSYTFTSTIKNYANNESLDHRIEHRDTLNSIFTNSKTILMVGWRHDSDKSFVDFMLEKNKEITIVEIYQPNTQVIQPGVNIICANILEYNIDKEYDLFLWQHGPEHVFKQEAFELISKIKDSFKHIILETPYGHWPQSTMYGNIHEAHVSEWYEDDYEKMGLNYVQYAGPTNESFIIGYK